VTATLATRRVPFFDYRGVFVARMDEFLAITRDVITRGAYIAQRDLAEFESALAARLGVKHALGVGNATDGLMMAWRAVGLPPGGEVLLSSHTMVATAAAVHFAGGVPVAVDIGDDGLMDPDAAERAITPRTWGISPTQLNGRVCDMHRLLALAERHGLVMVEDAAQALGATWRGRAAGTFGRAAAISFYPAKLLGCLGDGGAVVTDDDAVADALRLLRDHGRAETGEVVRWGLNSRLDNLQAAFLHAQLADYDTAVARRRAIAARYHAGLCDLPAHGLPPAPDADPDRSSVFQNYELEADDRDALRAHLTAHGVGTLVQWGGRAVHQQPAYAGGPPCPRTDRFFARCVMLPLHPMLDDDDVDHVIRAVRAFYGA
jgi:dTDP-4-amino-4,6-dideoxygalactose transaminase